MLPIFAILGFFGLLTDSVRVAEPEAPDASEERAAQIRAEYTERIAQIKNRHRRGSRQPKNY